MSIPLLLHYERAMASKTTAASAMPFSTDQDRLKIRRVTLEDNDDGARLTAAIAGQLQALQDALFDRQQHIRIADDAGSRWISGSSTCSWW